MRISDWSSDVCSSDLPVAVAAASIAQVHRAVTTEGETVAVKVLRPDVGAAFARDLALFLWLARLLERTAPGMRRLRPVEAVDSFADTVREAMDLRLEAAAASEPRDHFVRTEAGRVGKEWFSKCRSRVGPSH